MAKFLQPKLDGEYIRNVENFKCEKGQFVIHINGEHTLSLSICEKELGAKEYETEDELLRVTVKDVRLVMDMTDETKALLNIG